MGEEGIVGVDMLSQRVARIDLAVRTVSLEGFEIPLEQEDSRGSHRLNLAERTVVQALHRNLVKDSIVGCIREEP